MCSAEGRNHRAGKAEPKRPHASRSPTPYGLMASGHRRNQGIALIKREGTSETGFVRLWGCRRSSAKQ